MPQLPAQQVRAAVEKLEPGQKVSYKLAETFGGEVIDIENNPDYPGPKQRKYNIWIYPVVDGKATGNKRIQYSSNKVKDMVWFVRQNWGQPVKE